MMRKNKHYQKGAVILLYVIIVSIIAALLLTIAQSRLLLAVRRTQSSSDSLIALYQSESIANDYLARLVGGYLGEDDFPILDSFELSNSEVEVIGEQIENIQTITVVTRRGFAVSKVEGVREIESLGNYEDIDIILSLDCTGSMDAGATCDDCYDSPTRFDAQKEAAINFVQTLQGLEDANRFRLGILVFGIDANWIQYNGQDVKPDGTTSFSDILSALNTELGSTRDTSSACERVMDATSVGTPFEESHKYFSNNESELTKQIEIVITDGVPNSRQPSSSCAPNVFCPAFPLDSSNTNYCYQNDYNWECYEGDEYKDGPFIDRFNEVAYAKCQPLATEYLRCTLADTSRVGAGGIRNPDVDAYAVTIYNNPPSDVRAIFRQYTTPNGYFNAAHASQLTSILENVLLNIISERSIINLNRLIPEIDE